ncbi:MAG: hypothetical protein IPI67_23890 [Myxococcales bacterium]|nr:hypothetical protein [Myxococcales bacterium]
MSDTPLPRRDRWFPVLLVLVASTSARAQVRAPAPRGPALAPQPERPADDPRDSSSAHPRRQPVELHLLAGFGSAICADKQPDSECAAAGGTAFALAGAWRFHDHFSLGLEMAIWSFWPRDSWRGKLGTEASDAKFSSTYLAPFARWYWVEPSKLNPYLQGGFGVGKLTTEAKNDSGVYAYSAKGLAFPVAVGADWQLSEFFRFGVQLGAYLHVSTQVCETSMGSESCRSPGKNSEGKREGLALPWRAVAVGTFAFGG